MPLSSLLSFALRLESLSLERPASKNQLPSFIQSRDCIFLLRGRKLHGSCFVGRDTSFRETQLLHHDGQDIQLPSSSPPTMISRSTLTKSAQQAVRRSGSIQPLQRRGFAAAASSGAFETTDVSGLKVASRDAHGPTTKLAVVAKAGTRYQPLPGLTVGLEEFAFKVSLDPGSRYFAAQKTDFLPHPKLMQSGLICLDR